MKKLWKSQKANHAKFILSFNLISTIVATILYVFLPSSDTHNGLYLLGIGFGYGFSATYFAFQFLPELITEHKTNRALRSKGYIQAKKQDVRVIFNFDGNIKEIYYEHISYLNDKKLKEYHRIYSDPAHQNPQIHEVKIVNLPNESFAVVTERLSQGRVATTVYEVSVPE